MSTATIAEIRPLSSVKADMARAISNKGFANRVKSVTAYGPKKVAEVISGIVKFTKADVALSWLARLGIRWEEIVGRRTNRLWLLTGHAGQSSLRFAARTTYKVTKWSLHTAWRMLTWLPRQWEPTRRGIEAVENTARKVTMPEHNPAIVPVTIGIGWAGFALSADRWYMRAANLAATALIFMRLTRHFIPAGPWRVLAYVAELPFMFSKAASIFPNTTNSLMDRVLGEPALKEDAATVATEVVDSATVITSDAAEKAADAADAAVIALEEEKLRFNADIDARINVQNAEATRMREKAERLAAEAKDITEDVQPQGGVAVMTEETVTVESTSTEVVVPDAVIEPKNDGGKPGPKPGPSGSVQRTPGAPKQQSGRP